tara:strand:+ start:46535 stop:48964 length:2430 start_codon:yes stop_codon:yes gene_type:complete
MKNLFRIGLLTIFLAAGSCSDDYDDRFNDLEQKLQEVIQQIEGAADLSNAISALETQIETLKNAVGSLPDGDDLTSGLSALEAEIKALEEELAGLGDSQATADQLSAAIEALTADLNNLKGSMADLLESNNVVAGDLVIIDEATLAAAQAQGDKVAIVNGNVYVDARSLNATEVNQVISKIKVVLEDVSIFTDKSLDLGALETVFQDYIVLGHDIEDSALVTVGDGMELAFEGDYDYPNLISVGTDLNLYAGDEDAAEMIVNFSKLQLLGGDISSFSGFDFNTSISAIEIEDQDGDYDVMLTFENATEVIFGDIPVQHLVAPKATNIELNYEGALEQFGSAQYALYVLAPKAETLTIGAKETKGSIGSANPTVDILIWTLDRPEAGDFDDFNDFIAAASDVEFTIPQSWGSTISLPNLDKVTGHVFLGSKRLDLPLLKSIGEDYEIGLMQEVINLPELVIDGAFRAYAPIQMDLGSIAAGGAVDFSQLTSLNLHKQKNDFKTGYLDNWEFPELTSITILGDVKASTPIEVEFINNTSPNIALNARFPKLANLTLGGKIGVATIGDESSSIDGLPKLANIDAIDNINSLILRNNPALTTVSLDHEHIANSSGSVLKVINNDLLTSLTTNELDYIKHLEVTGNEKLESIDFSSMTKVLENFVADNDGNVPNDYFDGGKPATGIGAAPIVIFIDDNAIEGQYTPFVEQVGTADYEPEIVESSDLYSLKPLFDAFSAYAADKNMKLIDVYDDVAVYFTIDKADVTNDEVDTTYSVSGSSNTEDNGWFYTWSSTQDIITGIPVGTNSESTPTIN